MKILLTGNSFIYKGTGTRDANGPAKVFERLAKEGGHDVELTGTYIGGSQLYQHWNDTNGINPREELATGDYDLHIIAGGAGGSFDQNLDRFADLAQSNGTDILLYGLWIPDYMADANNDAFTDRIHNQYTRAAERNDGAYSPNGKAYRDVYDQITRKAGDNGQRAEEILTYDGIHASPYGAYIVAMTLYATVFGEKAPTTWRPSGISDADAKIAQDAAWKAYNTYAIEYGGFSGGSAPKPTVTSTTPPANTDTGAIEGKVFIDDDGNNRDDGDAGLSGVQVSLVSKANGRVIETTDTDGGGKYTFNNVQAGNYEVRFEDVANRDYVRANVGDDRYDSDLSNFWGNGGGSTSTIAVRAGERVRDVDAGVTKLQNVVNSAPAPRPVTTNNDSNTGNNTIAGRAFNDRNDDGRDIRDPGIANVEVQLWAEGRGVIATTTTASNGTYRFDDLPAGKYAVRFAEVKGAEVVKANVYNNDEIDSDVINVWGNGTSTTRVFTLVEGRDSRHVDVGFHYDDASSPSSGSPTSGGGTVNGLTGNNSANNLRGTNGADKINGNGGNDSLTGNGGNDQLNGGAGADRIFAGSGDDRIIFDNADTMVFGGGGNDSFVFSGGTYEFNNLRLESVENFDMENGRRDTITITPDDVRQAEGQLIISADNGDTVRLDTNQNVRKVGSKVIDGEAHDQYVIGSGGFQKFYLDDDASLVIV